MTQDRLLTSLNWRPMVGSAVATMVWSSAARNIVSIRLSRMVRTSSGASAARGAIGGASGRSRRSSMRVSKSSARANGCLSAASRLWSKWVMQDLSCRASLRCGGFVACKIGDRGAERHPVRRMGASRGRGSKRRHCDASEAIHGPTQESWIASSQGLLAMTAAAPRRPDSTAAVFPCHIFRSLRERRMDEISINTTTAGNQDQPSVAGFRGTQFAVVWADHGSGDIKCQMLGVNAVPTGGEFSVNFPGTPATKRQLPAIIETGQGLVAAWIEQAPGAPAQIKLRTLDADTLSGPESQVSTAEVEALIRPALAPLPDGGFIVVWADKRADERIRAQRYALDGSRNGAEFRANTVPGLHRVPMVATLANGNIVIAWRARSAAPLLVHLQLFDANGPVGTEQTTALDVTEVAMCALTSGRFVIADVRSAFDGEAGFDT